MLQPVTKAILTGGGRATRLRPITSTINKHLIPLAGKPMIFHAIEKVIEAGITDIFINTNPGDTQIQSVVGDGSRWGVHITYFEQTGGPQGIAHVVKCAQPFIGTDPFLFYLSDNIVLGSLKPLVERFARSTGDCLLTLAKVPDPRQFGVPQFDDQGKLVDVIEKPSEPPSDFAVTGIYLYTASFFKAFDQITKSARGEYEISSIHSYFLKHNFQVETEEITGWWKDTGKPDDLLHANHLLIDLLQAPSVTELGDRVWFGKNVKIGKEVVIKGPVLIGDNVVLEQSTVGPYVTIGEGSVLKNCTVTESIIFSGAEIVTSISIAESIIGEKVRVRSSEISRSRRLIVGDQAVIEL